MAEIYPLITENESLGINEIVSYVNQVTAGLFLPLFLLAIFIIIFVTTMWMGPGKAFTFASFFCSILSIFMAVGGWLSTTYMYLSFVLLAIGIMMLRLGKSSTLPQI